MYGLARGLGGPSEAAFLGVCVLGPKHTLEFQLSKRAHATSDESDSRRDLPLFPEEGQNSNGDPQQQQRDRHRHANDPVCTHATHISSSSRGRQRARAQRRLLLVERENRPSLDVQSGGIQPGVHWHRFLWLHTWAAQQELMLRSVSPRIVKGIKRNVTIMVLFSRNCCWTEKFLRPELTWTHSVTGTFGRAVGVPVSRAQVHALVLAAHLERAEVRG